jgi:inner membrane transporter RhtA
MNKPNPATGPLLAMSSMTISQLGATLAVPLMLTHGSFGISSMRLACAALVSVLLIRPDFRRFSAAQWKAALALGTAMALMTLCYLQAVTLLPVGPAITIDFLGPLAVAVVSLRGAARYVLPALALAGVLAMTFSAGGWLLAPVGIAFAAASGVAWAAYIVGMRRVGQLFTKQQGLCLSFVVAAIVALALSSSFARPEMKWADLPIAAGLAVLSPLLPFTLEMAALRRLPMAVFSIMMSVEPAIGTLLGFLILRQALSAQQSAGILLVITASVAAVVLGSRGVRVRTGEPSPAEMLL